MGLVTPKQKTAHKTIDANSLRNNYICSEVSRYIYTNRKDSYGDLIFKRMETGENVSLSEDYVNQFLRSAELYDKEVTVGKEDKHWTAKQLADAKKRGEDVSDIQVGDLRLRGIRTIWEQIPHNTHVFTVCFKKRDEALTKKEYASRREQQLLDALATIEKAKKGKKSVTAAAESVIRDIQDNPIFDYEEGELRILRGYKIQHSSRDGRYDCHDAEVTKGSPVRPVNINTIQWLIYNGVKYIVE